jgi:hypothetical protein
MENTRIEEINGEIRALKQILANSDYKAIKYAEGVMTENEYAETKKLRKEIRIKINQLEEELATISE